MIPGRTVRIRVNPTDCMSCLDVAKQVGYLKEGISFAEVVSIALRALLATVRQENIVPTRDGFEYSEMMAPYKDQPHLDRALKVRLTKALKMHDIPAVVEEAVEHRRARIRFEELAFKSNTDPTNMSEEEVDELRRLTNILHPDPDLQQPRAK